MQKQLKFLTMALAMVLGLTMTSCLDTDNNGYGYDAGAIVYVRSSYGLTYFEDAAGNTLIPTSESIAAIQVQNPSFDLSDYRMANILYNFVEGEGNAAQGSASTGGPQSITIDLVDILEIEVYTAMPVATEDMMETSMPETAPVIPLNGGNTSSGLPAYFDPNTLLCHLSYFVGSESALDDHHLYVAYVEDEIEDNSTELTLYVRHDRGDDNGTTYTYNIYAYSAVDISSAVAAFRQKTGHYPSNIVMKAKETTYGTTTLPSDYTASYRVTYKAPTE